MNFKETIKNRILETIDSLGLELAVSSIEDDTVLLESGLDSIGFAFLISALEEDVGFDPFVELEHPVYPATFFELVSIYEDRKDPNT